MFLVLFLSATLLLLPCLSRLSAFPSSLSCSRWSVGLLLVSFGSCWWLPSGSPCLVWSAASFGLCGGAAPRVAFLCVVGRGAALLASLPFCPCGLLRRSLLWVLRCGRSALGLALVAYCPVAPRLRLALRAFGAWGLRGRSSFLLPSLLPLLSSPPTPLFPSPLPFSPPPSSLSFPSMSLLPLSLPLPFPSPFACFHSGSFVRSVLEKNGK